MSMAHALGLIFLALAISLVAHKHRVVASRRALEEMERQLNEALFGAIRRRRREHRIADLQVQKSKRDGGSDDGDYHGSSVPFNRGRTG